MMMNLKNKLTLSLLVSLTISISACMRSDDVPAISGVGVVQASPTLSQYDFYIGTTRANQGVFDFDHRLDYLNVFSGTRQVTVRDRNSANVIVTGQITVENQMPYTLFLVDRPEQMSMLLLEDDLIEPAPGKAAIRYVALSPDAPATGLSITGVTSLVASDIEFKEHSDFVIIDAGNPLVFNIKNTATGETMASLPNMLIRSGGVYTIYARGYAGPVTGTMIPIGLALFEHK